MPHFEFPDPRSVDLPFWCHVHKDWHRGQGVVHVGPGLELDKITAAFQNGIYPMGYEGARDVAWHCPHQRAIIEFSNVRVPRSLAKVVRSGRYSHTIDKDFQNVMWGCRRERKNQWWDTWVTQETITQFTILHNAGLAHSVETWDHEGNLVGGLLVWMRAGYFAARVCFTLCRTRRNARFSS